MFRVIDTELNPEYKPLLEKYCKTISGPRSKNYINLKASDAMIWHMLFNRTWLIGFSGIQIPNPWLNSNGARILYRSYVAPEMREKGLITPRYNWNYSGKKQVKWCLEKKLVPIISRENTGNINAIHNMARYLGDEWTLMPNYYQTCDNMKKSCWQRIVAYNPDKSLEKIPNITPKEFMNLED